MRNNLKKKVCSLLVATLMTTATFANGFTYGGITVSAEESNVTVQNSGNVEMSGEKCEPLPKRQCVDRRLAAHPPAEVYPSLRNR